MRKSFIVLMLGLCLFLPSVAGAVSGSELTVLKVGKADAIVLQSSGYVILIDTGEDEDSREILDFLKKRKISRLDAMIVTHYDKDHVGGADGVLQAMDVQVLYDANYEADSDDYREYLAAIAACGVDRVRVTAPLTLAFGQLTLRLLPTLLDTDSDNDNSLVLCASDGLHTFLFAADAEEARTDELLAEGIGHHDVLKLPHHGRYKENLAALLDAVSPEFALITDSDKNPAAEETLRLLEDRGIDTYQTREGPISVLSGKGGITVRQ